MIIPESLRPSPRYGAYPPYTSVLLEDYFHRYAEGKTFARKYLGLSWTTLYIDGTDTDIQGTLDKLSRSDRYFTVCQHDDAPQRQILPDDTLIFSAGGNATRGHIIPIPLICSPIVEQGEVSPTERDLLCSFVGSDTHQIRRRLISLFGNDEDFEIAQRAWTLSVDAASLNLFRCVTKRSVFALCPRGYGKTSFRLYEVMQLGAIPVYVSDCHYLPWSDELDWNEFAVLIREEDIPNLKKILLSYTGEQRRRMVNKAKEIYGDYFSLDGLCKQIHKRVDREQTS